jgi:hypothetical protein
MKSRRNFDRRKEFQRSFFGDSVRGCRSTALVWSNRHILGFEWLQQFFEVTVPSSPSHFAWCSSGRITGIRVCTWGDEFVGFAGNDRADAKPSRWLSRVLRHGEVPCLSLPRQTSVSCQGESLLSRLSACHEISVSDYAAIRANCIVPFSVERVGANIYLCDLLF